MSDSCLVVGISSLKFETCFLIHEKYIFSTQCIHRRNIMIDRHIKFGYFNLFQLFLHPFHLRNEYLGLFSPFEEVVGVNFTLVQPN